MVTVVATGKVEHGKVVITATALPRQSDQLAAKPAVADEWERGRYAYFTALIDEGVAFEPSIEDGDWWKCPSIEDEYADIRMGN